MPQSHVVAAGDTLAKISARYYGDAGLFEELADHNGITDPNLIVVGQVIRMPSKSALRDGGSPQPSIDHGIAVPHGLQQIKETFGDIYRYIGATGTLSSTWERTHLGRVRLPFAIPLSWDRTKVVRNLYCHKKLGPVFKSVFETIRKRHLEKQIVSFGGCFNYRTVRDGFKLSTHSWGIAIDLNTETNQLGTTGDMDPRVVRVFAEHGFSWGGNWTGRKDPMHFQFCTGY